MTEIQSVGNEIVFDSSNVSRTAVVEIDDTHIMVCSHLSARIGTIDDSTIVFGNAHAFSVNMYYDINLLKLDSAHVLIVGGSNNKGVAFIATIDGNSITYGTVYEWQPAPNGTNDIVAIMLDATHFCIAFRAANTNNYGRCIIGTINGSTLSFGSEYQFYSRYSNNISLCRLTDTKFCIAFRDEATSGDPGRSIVGTVSNVNEITYGSYNSFTSGAVASYTNILALDSTHVCVVFRGAPGADYVMGTVSGNAITWGDVNTVNSASSSEVKSILVDSTTILSFFNDWTDGAKGTIKPGTIDGDTITWGDNVTINNGRSEEPSIGLIGDNKVIITYYDVDNSNYGTLVMVTYPSVGGYVRPDNITGLYNLSSQGSLRGKAAEGFVRPTLQQFFAPYRMAFEEVESYVAPTKGYLFGGNADLYGTNEYVPDTWASKSNCVNTIRGSQAVNILSKGYVLSATTNEYDPDTWTTKTSNSLYDGLYTSTISLNDKGYVITGASTRNSEYNPTGDSWASKTDYPNTARNHSRGTAISSKGYVFGGYSVYVDTEEYDSSGDSWSSKTNMPSPGRYGGSAITLSNKGYLFGGNSGGGLQDNDQYAPDTWTSKTDLPSPVRWYHSAAGISNKGYIFAGAWDLYDTDEYDPVGDSWTSKTDVPAGHGEYYTEACAI